MPSWKKVITSGSDAVLNSLSGSSFVYSGADVTAAQNLRSINSSGDEGGEIFLNKAVTNTSITGGVTIDVWQNRLRFFEQGGTARGYFLDITAGGAGVGTNLASGGGTVTSVSTAGTVSGITLTGGPITGAGTITLGGSISGLTNSNLSGTAGITNANLANSSVTIGSTAISLGSTSTTLAGLTSVTSTNFTGSLLGTASWATNVVNNGVTSVGGTGTVNGITLTGTVTSTGNLTLGGTLSGIGNSQLTNSSITIGSTAISLGGTSTTLAGLTSVTSTSFTGSLLGTASFARTASYAINPTISGSINNVDYIDFATGSVIGTNAPAWKQGRLFYDSGSGALAMYNWEQDVTLNIGQEQWLRARNQTGVTITNGSVVRLSSAIGDRPTVVLAQATDQSNAFSTGNEIMGMATHDIEHGTDGFITTFGIVNGVNTSAFTAGDLLWVSQSAGQFTNTPPAAPIDKTFVGIVTRANPSNGSIFMTPSTPIHFHDISSVSASTYQQGDLWMYRSGSAGLSNAWINTKQLSGSYGLTGSLTATSFTGSLLGTASFARSASYAVSSSWTTPGGNNRAVQFNNSGTLGGEDFFTYNSSLRAVTQGAFNIASANYAHAEGLFASASGEYSHAEGAGTKAIGNYSHAEGQNTIATGLGSHAEGLGSISVGNLSHAEGGFTSASADLSHAEGSQTIASGNGSHAEGSATIALGQYTHAEGRSTVASGSFSHAEGLFTSASGQHSHVEGYYAVASGIYSHAEGISTVTFGSSSHAEGEKTSTYGVASHAEGSYSTTGAITAYMATLGSNPGEYVLNSSYGDQTSYLSQDSRVLIDDTPYANTYGFTETTISSSYFSGTNTVITFLDTSISTSTILVVNKQYLNASQGNQSIGGNYGHAEGYQTKAAGMYSHAEGFNAFAIGDYSHAEGESAFAYGQGSHAEGVSETYGSYSHAEGNGSITYGESSHAEGRKTYSGAGAYNPDSSIAAGVFSLDKYYGDLTAQFAAGTFIVLQDKDGYTNGGFPVTRMLEIASSTMNGTPATEITLVDTSVDTGGGNKYRVGYSSNGIDTELWPLYWSTTIGNESHAQGVESVTVGLYSNASGGSTIALGVGQSVVGLLNTPTEDSYAFIVGGGNESSGARDNTLVATTANVTINRPTVISYNTGGTQALNTTDPEVRTAQVYDTTTKSRDVQEKISDSIGSNPVRNYTGDIIEGYVNLSNIPLDGQLCYLDSDDLWYLVDQSSTKATFLLGLPFNIDTGTGRCQILLEGHVTVTDSGGGSGYPYVRAADSGIPVYIENNTTVGNMDTTVPTTTSGTNVVRVLGHCYYQNSVNTNNWQMKFKPSNDWVLI